jgi:hypothetical protein
MGLREVFIVQRGITKTYIKFNYIELYAIS